VIVAVPVPVSEIGTATLCCPAGMITLIGTDATEELVDDSETVTWDVAGAARTNSGRCCRSVNRAVMLDGAKLIVNVTFTGIVIVGNPGVVTVIVA